MMKYYITKFLYKAFGKNKSNLKQIIICGFPRSGTSLMFNYVSSITGKDLKPYISKKEYTNEYSGIYLLRRLKSYITKRPEDCFKISDIAKWNVKNKKIFVILCVRDIRNLVVSRHHKMSDNYYLNLNDRWLPLENKLRPNGIKDFHKAVKNLIEKQDTLNKKNVHIKLVRYEDFVNNKNVVDNLLVDFNIALNKGVDDSRMPYSGRVVGRGHESDFSYKADAQKWKQKEEDLIRVSQIFEEDPEFFQHALEFYGYEEDKQWQDALKNINQLS